MKNKLFIISVVAIFLSHPSPGNGQALIYSQPRFMVGGNAALFRISFDEFESIYKNRVDWSYGGFAGMRTFSNYYLLVKYNTFNQEGKNGVHPETGADLSRARWQENWLCLGLRNHPPLTRKTQSYFGFGLVFFNVSENKQISLFEEKSVKKDSGLGNGFFLELGLEHIFYQRLAAFFEIEISSGGTRGKTGFESLSIGGYRFALGLTFWPF